MKGVVLRQSGAKLPPGGPLALQTDGRAPPTRRSSTVMRAVERSVSKVTSIVNDSPSTIGMLSPVQPYSLKAASPSLFSEGLPSDTDVPSPWMRRAGYVPSRKLMKLLPSMQSCGTSHSMRILNALSSKSHVGLSQAEFSV